MEQVNNRKFEVTANDLLLIGTEVERILEAIKKQEYGFYYTENIELKTKLALKIIEGLGDWQWQHNKGIRLQGDNRIRVEIYELHELEKRINKMMETDPFKTD